jgi:hypothetical protein
VAGQLVHCHVAARELAATGDAAAASATIARRLAETVPAATEATATPAAIQ